MKPSENRQKIAAVISEDLLRDIQGQIVKPGTNQKIMALYFILNGDDEFVDSNESKYEEYIHILKHNNENAE